MIKEIFPSKDYLSGTEWPFHLKPGRPKDSNTALLKCCYEMLSNENSLSANTCPLKERKPKRQNKVYRIKHSKIIMFLGKQRYVKEDYDALTINGKSCELDYVKMKTSVHHRMLLMSENARHGMGESISNTLTQLTFLSKGCKTLKSTIKGKTHPFFKRARDPNRHFPKENIGLPNKWKEISPLSLVIEKMQIKTTV